MVPRALPWRTSRRRSLIPGRRRCGIGAATGQRSLRRQEGAAGPAVSQFPADSASRPRPTSCPACPEIWLWAGFPLLRPRSRPERSQQRDPRGRRSQPHQRVSPRRMRSGGQPRGCLLPVTWRAGAEPRSVAGGLGEEERGEGGRQSGERKVRAARSGSETRESVRHCGPEKRRASGEEERAGGSDGPLPPTPEREALRLASQRAAAAAAAGTANSAEGGSRLL